MPLQPLVTVAVVALAGLLTITAFAGPAGRPRGRPRRGRHRLGLVGPAGVAQPARHHVRAGCGVRGGDRDRVGNARGPLPGLDACRPGRLHDRCVPPPACPQGRSPASRGVHRLDHHGDRDRGLRRQPRGAAPHRARRVGGGHRLGRGGRVRRDRSGWAARGGCSPGYCLWRCWPEAFAAILVGHRLGAVGWGAAALLGVLAAGVSHAVRRVLATLPAISGARSQLVSACASVLTGGVVVYVVGRLLIA